MDCRETTELDKGGKCLSVIRGSDVATGVDGDGGCSVVESQLYVGCVLLHFEQVSLPLYFKLEEEGKEDGQREEVSAWFWQFLADGGASPLDVGVWTLQFADVVECKHGVDGVNGVDGEPKAELSGTEKDNTRKRNFRERWWIT